MDLHEQYQDFIRWQCRLRKLSMRERDGRPSPGMSAGVHAVAGGDEQARINFLINRRDPAARTAEFRHIVRKTHDSSQWLKNGLKILAELQASGRISPGAIGPSPPGSRISAASSAPLARLG